MDRLGGVLGIVVNIAKGQIVGVVPPTVARWTHQHLRSWEVVCLGRWALVSSGSEMVVLLGGLLVSPSPWYGMVVGEGLQLGCGGAKCCSGIVV